MWCPVDPWTCDSFYTLCQWTSLFHISTMARWGCSLVSLNLIMIYFPYCPKCYHAFGFWSIEAQPLWCPCCCSCPESVTQNKIPCSTCTWGAAHLQASMLMKIFMHSQDPTRVDKYFARFFIQVRVPYQGTFFPSSRKGIKEEWTHGNGNDSSVYWNSGLPIC